MWMRGKALRIVPARRCNPLNGGVAQWLERRSHKRTILVNAFSSKANKRTYEHNLATGRKRRLLKTLSFVSLSMKDSVYGARPGVGGRKEGMSDSQSDRRWTQNGMTVITTPRQIDRRCAWGIARAPARPVFFLSVAAAIYSRRWGGGPQSDGHRMRFIFDRSKIISERYKQEGLNRTLGYLDRLQKVRGSVGKAAQ